MTPFIVAEMSANHLGSLKRAMLIVEAAAKAGADAIKLQTWLPGTMCVSDYVVPHGPWAGRKLRELYEQAHTPWAWHESIFRHARSLGLEPFSAAFDCESVDFLETLDVKRHKVASFELTDIPLIRHMASKRKPIILSAGMANEWEQDLAFRAALFDPSSHGLNDVMMLACTSAYPADPAEAGLSIWQTRGRWGFSDHSRGIGVACAAAALGACYIEKHLTLARADGGPDAAFSMEPDEFSQMVTECRRAAATRLNRPKKGEAPELRRSLWVTRPIERGEQIVLGLNVRTARPALGLPCDTPVTGRGAARALKPGEPLTQECLL